MQGGREAGRLSWWGGETETQSPRGSGDGKRRRTRLARLRGRRGRDEGTVARAGQRKCMKALHVSLGWERVEVVEDRGC